jgi:hypothetical protein
MFPLLVIGLVWLLLTAVMCVLIGRAIRNADVHDEEQAQREWAMQGGRRFPDAILGGRAPGSVCTLDRTTLDDTMLDYTALDHTALDGTELLDPPGLPDEGRRGPTGHPQQGSTTARPDVPRPRHPGP